MLRQFARVERLPCGRGIGRRSNDDLTLLRADRHRDHVALNHFAQPHAHVEPGCEDIELCICDQNVEPDARLEADHAL